MVSPTSHTIIIATARDFQDREPATEEFVTAAAAKSFSKDLHSTGIQITLTIDCSKLRAQHFFRTKSPHWEWVGKTLTDVLSAGIGRPFFYLGTLTTDSHVRIADEIAQTPRQTEYNFGLASSAYPATMQSVAQLACTILQDDGGAYKHANAIMSAASFFRLALENSKSSPSLAYSLLISSLECLAMTQNPPDSQLYDEESMALLEKIGEHPDFGPGVRGLLKQRLRQVKKRVSLAVGHFMNPSSYEKLESNTRRGLLSFGPQRVADVYVAVRAAYDLRSKYLHTGFDHSRWTSRFSSKDNAPTIVQKAPTLDELEGLTQHCLSWAIFRISDSWKAERNTT